MWSIGCVLFNIGTRGHVTFSEPDLVRYCDGTLSFNARRKTIHLGDDAVCLIKRLLKPDPEHRPSAADALQFSWFIPSSDLSQSNFSLQMSTGPIMPPVVQLPTSQRDYNSFLQSTLSHPAELDVNPSITELPRKRSSSATVTHMGHTDSDLIDLDTQSTSIPISKRPPVLVAHQRPELSRSVPDTKIRSTTPRINKAAPIQNTSRAVLFEKLADLNKVIQEDWDKERLLKSSEPSMNDIAGEGSTHSRSPAEKSGNNNETEHNQPASNPIVDQKGEYGLQGLPSTSNTESEDAPRDDEGPPILPKIPRFEESRRVGENPWYRAWLLRNRTGRKQGHDGTGNPGFNSSHPG